MGGTDLLKTVDLLNAAGMKLFDTIDTCYELTDQRIAGYEEDVAELKRSKILVDCKKDAMLLQVFSENQLAPIFF